MLSISQISETLFILAIPFFLQRYGIKKVMLLSIFADPGRAPPGSERRGPAAAGF
ncbi:MAG: hypothetical protein H0W53_09605 [Acidobacteria bacterium]|nr:hypothetical protein [Acidobacteriota bacterium]